MLLGAHYVVYGIDGIGLKSSHLFGRMLEAAAELMFVLLLILIAKGYTVTRARLPQASSIKLAVFVCAYTVIYCSLFIYERISFDPGQVSTLCIALVQFIYSTLIIICQTNFCTRYRQITLRILGCRFSSRLTATLNLCLIYFKII